MLSEVLQHRICDVIQPALGLDHPARDLDFQKLQLYVGNVYVTRHWFVNDFIMVQECQYAMLSLVELCGLLQRLLADASLAADFDACVVRVKECFDVVDKMRSYFEPAIVNLTVGSVSSIILMRSFERLCAAAGDKSSSFTQEIDALRCPYYNSKSGLYCFTSVQSVIEMMRHSKRMGRIRCDDYDYVIAGRNMFWLGTQPNTLASLFCTGAVCRLLQSSGLNALESAASTACELLELLSCFQLFDEASALEAIARSQLNALPSNLGDLVWLRETLWNQSSPPRFHDCFEPFEICENITLRKFCSGELKHLKKATTGNSLALPAADTRDNTFKRCNMLMAALVLSSLALHPAVDSLARIVTEVSFEQSVEHGQRAPVQPDHFFCGRTEEMHFVCSAVESVLLNTPRVSCFPAHVAVLGWPGVGKSLLVSQALRLMQRAHSDKHH